MSSMIRTGLFAAAVGLASTAGAATITNGSFETSSPSFSGGFETLGAGSTVLSGWTIVSGSVDLINTYWQASAGHYSLDMSGGGAGKISQTLTGLIVGHQYELAFDMAGNPDGSPAVKSLTASVGLASASYVFATGSASHTNMGWLTQTLSFTANNTQDVLTFASNTNTAYGPALDNVRLSEVPVPASGLLLLAGLGAFAALRRRKAA